VSLRSSAVFLVVISVLQQGVPADPMVPLSGLRRGTTVSSLDAGVAQDGGSTQFLDSGVSTHPGGEGPRLMMQGYERRFRNAHERRLGIRTQRLRNAHERRFGIHAQRLRNAHERRFGIHARRLRNATSDAAGAVNNVAPLVVDEGPTGVIRATLRL